MAAVTIERRPDGIVRVGIKRPDKRNALNDEVRNSLIAELPGLLGDVLGHRRGHAVDLGQREAPPARWRSRSASATRMSTARSASS